MPDPITRREFLQRSAAFAGAVAVIDPSWLFGSVARSDHPSERGNRRGQTDSGPAPQIEYLDGSVVRWTRLGDDYSLELRPGEIVMDVPVRSETPTRITLEDFAAGRGQQEVVQFFGPETLDQLWREVSYSTMMGQTRSH